MTANDFRHLALSFQDAAEGAHMGHADFRVRGKIFATLNADETLGMVKLTPEQQRGFIEEEPTVFAAVPGGWGRGGAAHVKLAKAKKAIVQIALEAAWKNACEAATGGPARRRRSIN